MPYDSVSPEDLMLAITLANSKGLPMVSYIVPRTFMVWAERENDKRISRIDVVFIIFMNGFKIYSLILSF